MNTIKNIIILCLTIVILWITKPLDVIEEYSESKKINYIIHQIYENYVDSIDVNSLTESSIEHMLQNLDPHSYYLNSEQVSSTMEMMKGSFEGIGVEFSIHRDTIIIVNVIPGGPSEKKGIVAGERIIFIEDENVAGVNISNEGVIKRLRGKGGTKVKVGLVTNQDTTVRFINITRGKIPLNSIDVSYEIAPNIGYIKLNRFSGTTSKEFNQALKDLITKNKINSLILDLRGNSGGYLDEAIDILNEFFNSGKLLVYTKGKARKEEKYFSDYTGSFKNGEICVLIDEDSASASEILAGAIQDHDRGIIVGEKSFGKGLVQEQIPLKDGSLIRLTVARYYTPSGRCIQKPYETLDGGEYTYDDAIYNNQPFATDSLQKFYTNNGRVVYGGGGITPDHIVASNRDYMSPVLVLLYTSDFFNNLIFDYVDTHRTQFMDSNFKEFQVSKQDSEIMLDKIIIWLVENTEEISSQKDILDEIKLHEKIIIKRLHALIIRQQWGWGEMQIFLNESDEVISTSLSLLQN